MDSNRDKKLKQTNVHMKNLESYQRTTHKKLPGSVSKGNFITSSKTG